MIPPTLETAVTPRETHHLDFDHPASKLVAHPTVATFYSGNGTYVSAFILDPDHGFTNCVVLRA